MDLILIAGGYYLTEGVKFTTLNNLVAYYSQNANGLTCRLTRVCLATDTVKLGSDIYSSLVWQ